LAVCIEKGLPEDGSREVVDREAIYRSWLSARLVRAGLEAQSMVGRRFHMESLLRRNHTPARDVRILRRPDAEFEVVAVVRDAVLFNDALRRGFGRHRAFGFGMIRLLRIEAC
jgi:CRISPR system Cascade subunit CasE